jgi:hypothetical protein
MSNELQKSIALSDELDKAITDRISDLHQIKGCVSERQSFMYLRSFVWNIKNELKKLSDIEINRQINEKSKKKG